MRWHQNVSCGSQLHSSQTPSVCYAVQREYAILSGTVCCSNCSPFNVGQRNHHLYAVVTTSPCLARKVFRITILASSWPPGKQRKGIRRPDRHSALRRDMTYESPCRGYILVLSSLLGAGGFLQRMPRLPPLSVWRRFLRQTYIYLPEICA